MMNMNEEKKEQEQVQHPESLASRAERAREASQGKTNERRANCSDENKGGQCLER